jgi:hypothetical protein
VKWIKRHLDSKSHKKADSNKSLLISFKMRVQKNEKICTSRNNEEVKNPKQHDQRSEKCVKKEQIGSLDFTFSCPPYPDEDKHRDE